MAVNGGCVSEERQPDVGMQGLYEFAGSDLLQPYVPLFAAKIMQDLRRQFVALLRCLLQEGLAFPSMPGLPEGEAQVMQCVRFAFRHAASKESDLFLRVARFGIEVGQHDQDIDFAVLKVLFKQVDGCESQRYLALFCQR